MYIMLTYTCRIDSYSRFVVRFSIALMLLIPAATAVSSSTVSNFGNVGSTTLRRATGLLAGAYIELPLTRVSSLQPEVVYTQKGIDLDALLVADAPPSANGGVTERFAYIEVRFWPAWAP